MRAGPAVQRAGVSSEEVRCGAGCGAGRPGQRPDRRRGVPGVRVRGVHRQQLGPVQNTSYFSGVGGITNSRRAESSEPLSEL